MLDLDARVTVNQAARCTRLSPQLINRWYQRGLIQPVDVNARGHRLYRLGDITDREREARSSKRSPRNFRLRLAPCSTG